MGEGAPADDRGLLLGDGLFETLLVDRGRPLMLARHLARLGRGCAVLGLPPPAEAAVRGALQAALQGSGLAEARAAARITWTAGSGGRGLDRPAKPAPRLLVSLSPAPWPTGELSLVTADVRRNEGSPASRVKSLAYLDNVLARAQARAAGADEALMLNNRGDLACAAAANLFWIADGRLFTPALACGVLDGIVRAAVLERASAMGVAWAEVSAQPQVLARAEGVFITNSLIGVRPVARLDGRDLAGCDLVSRLAELGEAVIGVASA